MMTSKSHSHWDLRGLFDGFECVGAVPAMQVQGICSDSRQVQHGDVFFAIPGIGSNGIDYVQAAVEAGAVAIVYDASDAYSLERVQLLQKQLHILWLGINDLAKMAGEIASRFYGYPSRDMVMIGVTGTDGKSSVTHLLVQALSRLGKRCGSIGTLGAGINNELSLSAMTTPMAFDVQRTLADFRQQGCQSAVMEVSSHALHQYRVSGCEYNLAVFTNLGRDHLDYHGDMDSYANAKARLFTEFPLEVSILNLDDEFGHQLLSRQKAEQTWTYSASAQREADVQLIKGELLPDGLRMSIYAAGHQIEISSHLLGQFNIDNTLACVACLMALNYEPQQIAKALNNLRAIPGRMECFSGAGSKALAVVDFAHTEQALRACLKACRQHVSGDLWCVFGCGGDRDPGKRPLMGAAAEALADHLIVTNDNPRNEDPTVITDDILAGLRNPSAATVIHDRLEAIRFALTEAGEGDLVVIAGKGHEEEQIVGDQRLPFSDRQVVTSLLGESDD